MPPGGRLHRIVVLRPRGTPIETKNKGSRAEPEKSIKFSWKELNRATVCLRAKCLANKRLRAKCLANKYQVTNKKFPKFSENSMTFACSMAANRQHLRARR